MASFWTFYSIVVINFKNVLLAEKLIYLNMGDVSVNLNGYISETHSAKPV